MLATTVISKRPGKRTRGIATSSAGEDAHQKQIQKCQHLICPFFAETFQLKRGNMSCQMRQAHEKLRVPHESFEVVQVQVAKYTTLFDGFLFSYRSTNRHLALWEFSPPGKVGFVINHSKMTIQESTSLASMVNGFLDGFLDEISLSGMISWMVSSRCFQSSLSGWKYHTNVLIEIQENISPSCSLLPYRVCRNHLKQP